jgi:hypothetical protein
MKRRGNLLVEKSEFSWIFVTVSVAKFIECHKRNVKINVISDRGDWRGNRFWPVLISLY